MVWRGRSLGPGPLLWPHNLTTGVIADVVTFLGLLLTLWARVVLGGNWSSGVAFKEQHELIERGPYAYVRHPIYSGVLLMFLGISDIPWPCDRICFARDPFCWTLVQSRTGGETADAPLWRSLPAI